MHWLLARAATLLSAAQRCFDIVARRAQLGDEAFESAWAAGPVMTLAAACERTSQV